MTKEMANRETVGSGEKGEKYVDFSKSFHDLSKELAGAYTISENIYSQPSSTSRFEKGISINRAEEFLNHVEYNPNKAGEIIKDFAKSHKPIQFYSGKDIPINLGVNIGSEELLSLGPDSKANGRSPTIAALAQRAARLEALLSPHGIPEVYALAQGQARKALKLVEKSAEKAYDWKPGWGRLNVDNALNEARDQLTRKKVAQGAMVGVLALAGCSNLPNPMDPISTYLAYRRGTPTPTEVVPELTKTPTPRIDVTPTATATEAPVLMPELPDNADNIYTKEQMDAIESGVFSDQESALTDWTQNVWTQGENRIFPSGTAQLHFRYFFDPHRPNKGGVCLESMSFPDVCMGIPTDSNGEKLPTPTAGYGPAMYSLTLDSETAKQIDSANWQQLEGSTLGWRYNQWVRFKDGAVVATIGMEGRWILADSEALNRLEITENINEYLAASDIYSDENLAETIFIYGPAQYKADNELGLFAVSPNFGMVQGLVLGEVKGDNSVWVFLGTKMGEGGERAVIPLKIPFEQMEHQSTPITILFYSGRGLMGDMPPEYLDDEQMDLTNQEDTYNAIDRLINKPVMLNFWYTDIPGLESGLREYVLSHGGTEDDAQYVYQFFIDEYNVQAESFCSFHPIMNMSISANCSGYQGVSITSEVQAFDESWLAGDNFLSTTVLTSYIDNK